VGLLPPDKRSRVFMVSGGRFHPVAGGDLARFIGYPNADFNVLDYVVLNHLAVIVRADADSVDISLNAQDCDSANMQAVIEHVSRDRSAQSIQIRSYLGGWLTETFTDRAQPIDRLRRIAARALAAPTERHSRVPQDPAASRTRHDQWTVHFIGCDADTLSTWQAQSAGARLVPFASLDGRPLVVGYGISSGDLALPR